MKEIIRRVIIVSWLAVIVIFIAALIAGGIYNPNTWFIPLCLAAPTWAAQYIFLGVVSPVHLFRK